MITDIMLDLETLGTGPNAAIVSIGAVAFNATQPVINQPQLLPGIPTEPPSLTYYQNVDLAESEHPGDIDAATVMWWLAQPDKARKALTREPLVTLGHALMRLRTWIQGQGPDLNLWSNGPTFDEVIIRSAYRRYAGATQDLPIHFWRSRCCRSLKEQAEQMGWVPLPNAREDLVAHNALHDAIGQARALVSQKTFMRARSTYNPTI